MSCNVSKSSLSGTVTCPASKSYTHRAIFVASLAEGKSSIKNALLSEDTKATIRACKSFGAIIDTDESIIVSGCKSIRPADIDAGNSGTTIRIAAAMASLGDKRSTLTGDSSLQKRPMQPLLDALESMGAKHTSNSGRPPVSIEGIITGGTVRISGNVSSQFISALLIMAPMTKNGITLEINGDAVSKPYLDATVATMEQFGASIHVIKKHQMYNVPSQRYVGADFEVPADASSLALLLSAAVLVGKDLAIKTGTSSLPQGDAAFADMLVRLGVAVKISDGIIRVESPDRLAGGRFDLSDTPDLLPPLAILALKSDKPIEIINVRHARFKETDRIKIICRELVKVGLDIKEQNDGMILRRHALTGAELDSEGDHRLFMAFCIAGMYVGQCTVSGQESVSVSYPGFVSEMSRLGGRLVPDS